MLLIVDQSRLRITAVASGLLLFLSFVSHFALAQGSAIEIIEVKRTEVERIVAALDDAPEDLRDGMSFRADFLTIELAGQVLAVPVESVQQRDEFIEHVDWLHSLVIDRFERLQERIREEKGEFEEFDDSMQASISRAFQQDLRKLSSQYINIVVGLMDVRDRLGLVDEQERQRLQSAVILAAERISGQIMLDTMTLSELRNMLRIDAGNSELVKAVSALTRKTNRNYEALEQMIDVMEELGINVGSYRALLLAERGSVGVEMLDRDVLGALLASRFNAARQQLITKGPNVIFQSVVFLLLLTITYIIARFVQRLVTIILHRDSVRIHQLMENMLISISFGVTFVIGLIVALSTIGISLVPMLAGLGVAGIVIGFALQDTLSNFASGWMILVYRPYDVDDHVKAGGVEGVVKRMNLVSTTIATFDNQRLVIPNSKIWGDVITNLTANRTRRLTIPVSVSFGEDLDRVEQVLREEIEQQEGILAKPEPNVFVDSLGTSEIVMMTHAWVRTNEYWARLRSLTKRFKQRLDEEDMEIPFPQQDIYIRSLPDNNRSVLQSNDPSESSDQD